MLKKIISWQVLALTILFLVPPGVYAQGSVSSGTGGTDAGTAGNAPSSTSGQGSSVGANTADGTTEGAGTLGAGGADARANEAAGAAGAAASPSTGSDTTTAGASSQTGGRTQDANTGPGIMPYILGAIAVMIVAGLIISRNRGPKAADQSATKSS